MVGFGRHQKSGIIFSNIMPLTCPRCGGDIESQQTHPLASGALLPCPYCSATLYCQQGFCLSHEVTSVLLESTDAKRILRRWFREHYDLQPVLLEAQLRYLPFWATTEQSGEKHLQLAVSSPFAGVPSPSHPEGHREAIAPETATKKGWPQPSISLEAVSRGKSIQEASLIWAPFYWVTYKAKGKIAGAWVDASLGRVSANPPQITPSPFPYLKLSPLGYGIAGAIAGASVLVSIFSPHLILSFVIILALSGTGAFALGRWGKGN